MLGEARLHRLVSLRQGQVGKADGHDHDVLLIETQIPALHVVRLPVDDGRADDEDDGRRELEDDQALAQQGAAAEAGARLQDRCRLEARQRQSGIAARQEAGGGRQGQHPGGQTGIGEGPDGEGLAQEVVEEGEAGEGEGDRQDQRQSGDEDGLAQELPRELTATGAENLAQTDLARPVRGPRHGEVHEVDAGDDEDEGADETEGAQEGDVPVRASAEVGLGVEVDAVQPLQAISGAAAACSTPRCGSTRAGSRASISAAVTPWRSCTQASKGYHVSRQPAQAFSAK